LSRRAVILFNLGGPDSLAAVKPFLFNLFNDPAIVRVPQPLRWMIAKIIAARRDPFAQDIYRKLGGASPLLPQTQAQAEALERALNREGAPLTRVFIAMRYWHPFTEETVADVKDFAPDAIVLLPLYPQFSTTTTESSWAAWRACADEIRLHAPTGGVRSYPTHPGFVDGVAALLRKAVGEAGGARVRVLFSAHGLPQRIVDAGDPYPEEVAASAAAVAAATGLADDAWRICYQSRVGPMKWLSPSIDHELENAARDGMGVIVVPIAFVSEHSETLVELDIDYRERAHALGVKPYIRVPAVGTHPAFVAGLASLVEEAKVL
jgi:protoporphyrin/coproporphyrin ferrochelatase